MINCLSVDELLISQRARAKITPMVVWRTGQLIHHCQDEEQGQLLDVLNVAQAVVTKGSRMAPRP